MILPLIETVATVLLLAGALFGAAGDPGWPMAWAFLLVFVGFAVAAFLVLDRDLIVERSGLLAGSERADARLSVAFALLLYPGTLVVCGLDRRLGWSPPVPPGARVAALTTFCGGYAFALWAMRANRFFATVVRIQTERGHRVVDRGPYRWVRHPGYAGFLVAHLVLPIWLGSPWALVPAALGAILLAVRAVREERTLLSGLPGYREYAARVRWRFVPYVW